jgi:hypothetical protein
MACVPVIRRHSSCSSQFVAALPRLIPAFIYAGGVPEHMYLVEPQWRFKEQGFWLRLATCYAKIAGLLASLAFISSRDGGNCHLEAIEGPRQVCFGGLLLELLCGSHGWLPSPSCPADSHCLPQLFHLFLSYFSHYSAMFRLLNFTDCFLLSFFSFSHVPAP